MKKVIITGVTGTIGMALLQELTEQGIEVLAYAGKDLTAMHRFLTIRRSNASSVPWTD